MLLTPEQKAELRNDIATKLADELVSGGTEVRLDYDDVVLRLEVMLNNPEVKRKMRELTH